MLYIEIAETPSELETGLMFRKKLSFDAGMLFKLGYPQRATFWGKNTFIPLDIAFIKDDGTISKIDKIDPFDRKPVTSSDKCNMVLEVNAGYFSANDIDVGDTITFDKYENYDIILFDKHEG